MKIMYDYKFVFLSSDQVKTLSLYALAMLYQLVIINQQRLWSLFLCYLHLISEHHKIIFLKFVNSIELLSKKNVRAVSNMSLL